jgi:hypothetical protein
MNIETILSNFEDEVELCLTIPDLIRTYKKYEQYNHPYIEFHIAETLTLLFCEGGVAHNYYLKAFSYASAYGNKYFDKSEMLFISQSINALLNYYSYPKYSEVHFKLICLCFIYSTNYISNNQRIELEALKSRNELFRNKDLSNQLIKMMHKYYYDGDDLCIQILTISDIWLRYKCFQEIGNEAMANQFWNTYINEKNIILSLPQYTVFKGLGDTDLVALGLNNLEHLYSNLVQDYKRGNFNISASELIELQIYIKED